jgi:hypothetical protein
MLTFNLGRGSAYVDFNRLDERGRLTVSRTRFSGFRLGPGQLIRLQDTEGNSCEAVVEQVTATRISTHPDLSTWIDAPHIRATVERELAPTGASVTWEQEVASMPANSRVGVTA